MSEEAAFEVGRLFGPLTQIANTLTASQKDVFIRLPGLLGYWPMGIRDNAGNVPDHAGGGGFFTEVGTCPTGYDGNSFVHLGNGINYLTTVTSFGVTGLETWISSSIRGLTLGGWFMFDALPASAGGLLSKDAAAPNRGYYLAFGSGSVATFSMSATGAAQTFATSATATLSSWHFVVGRFIPSAEVAVFVDSDKTANATAVPAQCNVSTGNFEVGRFQSSDAFIQHGKSRDVFICAAALSDALIEEVRVTSTP